MKPIIILPPNQVSDKHVTELRKNDLCVVVAKDPAKVKFVDPIPAISSRTTIENACIKLSRILLNNSWRGMINSDHLSAKDFAWLYIQMLTTGTPLDQRGGIAEQEQAIVDCARREELKKMAREDARAEREAKKKAALQLPVAEVKK